MIQITSTAGPTVPSWIRHWAAERGDRPALTFEDTTWTWRALEHAMDVAAGRLRAAGVRGGDRVACCLPNRPEFIIAYLATVRLGAVFVPMNHRLTATELDTLEQIVTPAVTVVDTVTRELLRPHPERRLIDTEELVHHEPLEPGVDEPHAQDLVAVLFTSGTTGVPKGAMFTHDAFATTAYNSRTALGLTADDVHLAVSPLSFTGGILTSTQPVLNTGGHLVLMARFDTDEVLDAIQRHRPTIFMAVPSMLALLAEQPRFEAATFASLRYLGSGSAPAPAPLVDRYRTIGIHIGHAYGLTEGGGLQTVLTHDEIALHQGTAGRACAAMQLRIVDGDGRESPTGTPGQIQVKSPATMSGYWRNPARTAEVMHDGWVSTGDVGALDADGYLTVRGRTKEVILSGGINVYPVEVENVLAAHPGILEAAVVGTPSETFGETVTAVIVPRDGQLAVDDVVAHCRRTLAPYKVPKIVTFVQALPRNASGKVRKTDLVSGR